MVWVWVEIHISYWLELCLYHNQFQIKEIDPATSSKEDLYVLSMFFEEYMLLY